MRASSRRREGIASDELAEIPSAETWKSPKRVLGYGPYDRIRGRRRIASAAMIALIAFRGV